MKHSSGQIRLREYLLINHRKIFSYSIKNKNALVKEIMWGSSEFEVSGNLNRYERLERIPDISIRTLITCGRYDLTPPASCKMYQQKFVHADLKIFENSSHVPHLEEQEQYADVLNTFF